MKKRMSGLVALTLALILALGTSGLASETASEAFRFTGVTERPQPQQQAAAPAASGGSATADPTPVFATDLAEPLKCIVNLDPTLMTAAYAEANAQSETVAVLNGGSAVDVTGYVGEFSKIALQDGQTGYVLTTFLVQAPAEQAEPTSQPLFLPEQGNGPESVATEAPATEVPAAVATEAPTAEPTATPITVQPLPEPVKYRVNLEKGSWLDVYNEASASSTIVSQMEGGFEVNVTGTLGEWLQICLPDGMVGYVLAACMTQVVAEPVEIPEDSGSADFVDEDGNIEEPDPTEQPIVEETPAPTEEPIVDDTPAPELPNEETENSEETNNDVATDNNTDNNNEETPEETPAPETTGEDDEWYEVTADRLNVRVAPNKDAHASYQATKGYVFHVIGHEGGWSKVLLPNGETAYVKSDYLVKVDPPAGEQSAPETAPEEEPTAEPTAAPEEEPTDTPQTAEPTEVPTEEPTDAPEVAEPTDAPEAAPSAAPEDEPSAAPQDGPSFDGEIPSDAPSADTAPEQQPERQPAPEQQPEQQPAPERQAKISINWADPEAETHNFGDEVILSVDLSDYEGLNYDLQWQTGTTEDSYVDVPDATEAEYRTIVTKDNIMNYWRVEITTKEVEPVEEAEPTQDAVE